MLQNSFIKNSKVCCATTNINNSNACLKIMIAHYRRCRSQWLKNKIFCFQSCLINTAVNISYCIFITCDDVKICTNFYTAVTNWVRNVLKIIYGKFLRYHINDLVSGRYVSFILIIYQLINFCLLNFFIRVLTYNVATGLKTLNVMPCNTNVHFAYRQSRIAGITIFQRRLYGFNSLIDVQHHTVLYTVAVGTAKAENFKFAKLVFTSGNGGNFCSANVQTDNNGLFAVHSCMCFCCEASPLIPLRKRGRPGIKNIFIICFLQFII